MRLPLTARVVRFRSLQLSALAVEFAVSAGSRVHIAVTAPHAVGPCAHSRSVHSRGMRISSIVAALNSIEQFFQQLWQHGGHCVCSQAHAHTRGVMALCELVQRPGSHTIRTNALEAIDALLLASGSHLHEAQLDRLLE